MRLRMQLMHKTAQYTIKKSRSSLTCNELLKIYTATILQLSLQFFVVFCSIAVAQVKMHACHCQGMSESVNDHTAVDST